MTSEQSAGATESEERMKRFLAVASHDLQSPLRHIAMYAEILMEDLAGSIDTEQARNLKTIFDKAQAAQRLTKALMSFATGAPQITIADIDLQALVGGIWEELVAETGSRGAILQTGSQPIIRSDAIIIGLVLKGVLENALVHRTGHGAIVEVDARREPSHWQIDISDNGPGIDPAYGDKIFDAFWKLQQEGQPVRPGLGLAAARELLAALGGDIRLDHSDGGGSRFTISLPA